MAVAPVRRFITVLALLLFASPLTCSFASAWAQSQNAERPGTLVVSVRMPDGSPLDTPANVNRITFSGTSAGIGVFRAGTAEFTNLTPASYTLEILAAGYQPVTQEVRIQNWGERQQVSVTLTPESVPSSLPPPGSPLGSVGLRVGGGDPGGDQPQAQRARFHH